MNLKGKKILLGVTGGIAAYKACELLRILQKRGAEVRVAMTSKAADFVGKTTFAALSNFPVYAENSENSNIFQHIDYPRWADIYLIAPCSATSLARFAAGIGEEPVSLCFLAMQGEKCVVPAMNSVMYSSPAVQRNLKTLSEWGVSIIEPACGHLACGEEGTGKFPEPTDIADEIEFGRQKYSKTLLITMGRTEEAIDPVRYISNRSNGKTGVAIAKEFLRNGWKVIAVCGPMEAMLPKQCETVYVKSASDMNKTVLEMQHRADAIAHCAAVADYSPKTIAKQKIKNSKAEQNLELKENPNILKNTIKNKKTEQKIAAFALETENAIEYAKEKFEESGADVLVVNTPVSGKGGFGKDSVEFALLGKNSPNTSLIYGSKEELALQLFEALAK